jgi:hypothetical protein
MIVKEGLPSLQWPTWPRHHVFRNRGLGNGDADLEQLTMDLGCAPERILKTHSADKVAHLFSDPRSATERTRLPPPVSGKARSVPTHNRLGPDEGYGIKDARKATIEPNEQGAVGPAQIQSTWCALSKHVQLMTQNQNFSLKPPSRLEAITQPADEKEGDCHHQSGSCSDSLTSATPADGVFGSDRRHFANNPSQILDMVQACLGVAVAGERLPSAASLLRRPIAVQPDTRTVILTTVGGRPLGPTATLFLKLMRARAWSLDAAALTAAA